MASDEEKLNRGYEQNIQYSIVCSIFKSKGVGLLKERLIVTPESIHDDEWDHYHSDFEEVKDLPRTRLLLIG